MKKASNKPRRQGRTCEHFVVDLQEHVHADSGNLPKEIPLVTSKPVTVKLDLRKFLQKSH